MNILDSKILLAGPCSKDSPATVSCPDCGQILGVALFTDQVGHAIIRAAWHHACKPKGEK